MPPEVHRLHAIAAAFYGGSIDRDAARSQVIDVVTDRLHCARVSLWRFEGDGDALALLGFAAKTRGGHLDTREQRLTRAEYRDYFNELIVRGTFVTEDAAREPALAAMQRNYVERHAVRGMLDAAFLLNGRAFGMVCCEEPQPRAWKPAEVNALRAIVTRLAMLMASRRDAALWAAPSLPLHDLR